VRRYYETLLACDARGVGVGAFAGRRLAGFCFLGRRFEIEPEFLRRHRGYLALQLALRPWVLADRLFRRRLAAGCGHLWKRRAAPAHVAASAAESASDAASFGVQYLVVHPHHQGLGVGRLLLDAAENRARAAGRRLVELSVFTDNAPAIHFYERQGWQKVVSGPRWDGLMAKRLLAPAALLLVQQWAEIL
jgi:ribosomal protein S18 acetylase RimI-like enzyme